MSNAQSASGADTGTLRQQSATSQSHSHRGLKRWPGVQAPKSARARRGPCQTGRVQPADQGSWALANPEPGASVSQPRLQFRQAPDFHRKSRWSCCTSLATASMQSQFRVGACGLPPPSDSGLPADGHVRCLQTGRHLNSGCQPETDLPGLRWYRAAKIGRTNGVWSARPRA